MPIRIFRSNRWDALAERLAESLEQESGALLKQRVIWTSNRGIHGWLTKKVADLSPRKVAAGLKMVPWKEGGESRLEMAAFCYRGLGERLPHLAPFPDQLAAAAFELGGLLKARSLQVGEEVEACWQEELYRQGGWGRRREQPTRVRLFGCDDFPPGLLSEWGANGEVEWYLFSPCALFWEDVAGERERRLFERRFVAQLAVDWEEWERFHEEAHPLLGNWGALGRRQLKRLAAHEVEEEERYVDPGEEPSLLRDLQRGMLTLEGKPSTSGCRSVCVEQCGSTNAHLAEALRNALLAARGEGILFREMGVYAPDLEPLLPWMAHFFAECEIPWKVEGVAMQSPLLTALGSAVEWVEQGRPVELFAELCLKIQADREERAVLERWLALPSFAEGLERGFSRLLHSLVSGRAEAEHVLAADRVVEWSEAEILEKWMGFYRALSDAAAPIGERRERPLAEWADCLEKMGRAFGLEEDTEGWGHLERLMRDCREIGEGVYPFGLIKPLLRSPLKNDEGASQEHAVVCAPLELGRVVPLKALFFVGMEEEAFPRSKSPSPLSWFKQEEGAVEDRYAFLQAIHQAKDRVWIGYRHFDSGDKKEIPLSGVVQELVSYLGIEVKTYRPQPFREDGASGRPFLFPPLTTAMRRPEESGESSVISLADLERFLRDPWRWGAEKEFGCAPPRYEKRESRPFTLANWEEAEWVEEERLVADAQVRGRAPIGVFGRAACKKVSRERREWIARSAALGLPPPPFGQLDVCLSFPPYVQAGRFRYTGKVRGLVPDGVVWPHDKKLYLLLPKWPALLAGLLATGTEKIYLFQQQKVPVVEISRERAEKELERIGAYFHGCRGLLSPLIPDWQEPLLRRGELEPLETEGGGDPIYRWVYERLPPAPLNEVWNVWAPMLREVFQELISLLPIRKEA